MSKRWQEQALADAMEANRGKISSERMTLRLADPVEEARLDDIILFHLWPGAERGLLGTQWMLSAGTTGNLRDSIRTEYGGHTRRSATAIIADPQRSIPGYHGPPWFCRVEIVVETHGYHLRRDTILSFPEDFSWMRLQQLLKEPELQGYPPELSWSGPFAEKRGEFTVSLAGGHGLTWLPSDLDVAERRAGTPKAHFVENCASLFEWNKERMAQAADDAERLVRGQVKIAQAMDALSAKCQSAKWFGALHDAVLEVYEAW